MKFYSETLKELFDTEAQLQEAEKSHKAKIEAEAAAKKEKETALVTRKKELAKAVDACDAELDESYKKLEAARAEAKRIIDDANKQANALVLPAVAQVEDAQRARVQAISAFNKEFGPFKTSYTGDRAQQEFERINNMFSRMFNPFF